MNSKMQQDTRNAIRMVDFIKSDHQKPFWATPYGSEAVVYIPVKEKTVIINGQKVNSKEKEEGYKLYPLKGGSYTIISK